MKIVIGSGPAGIACTRALLARGESVTMLDAGTELEPKQQELLGQIREGNAFAFDQLAALQSAVPISDKGVHLKLAYGSAFPYRGTEELLGFQGHETGLLPSLALGGLSNVWGAAALPYRGDDIPDWPVKIGDLADHYIEVARFTGLSARSDDLASVFPLYTDQPSEIRLSSQARRLLSGLENERQALHQEGITFGQSRLMIGPSQAWKQNCVYCGQCLYGCPHSCIYNSAEDVRWLSLNRADRFTYRANFIVQKLTEITNGVVVSGLDRLKGGAAQFETERAFVAAGVIPTSRIMLKSLEAYDHPLLLRDSQYFVLPLLSLAGCPVAPCEQLHTLSQLFLEIQDEKISPYTVHLQVYTYNDLFGKVLRKKLWFAPGLRELMIGLLQHRLFLIQGYLHSDHSGTMKLCLTRDSASGKERLIVEGERNAATGPIVQRVIRKMAPHLRRLGLHPLRQGLDITLPGRGFHSGGSFPMRTRPAAFETDPMGRPTGTSRIHLVDASTFPTVPATTITFTAMANAHRIGSEWNKP